MDEQPRVILDGAQIIMNIVKKTFGDTFKLYALGIPDVLPEAAYPAVIIHKIAGTFTAGATMTDNRTENILVHIMANKKEGFGAPEDDDTVMRQIFNRVEGIDPATGNFLPNTFMYALRQNLTLEDTVINNDVEINYDVAERPDMPLLYEAIIVVSLERRVIIPNRR